jgi:isoamylase
VTAIELLPVHEFVQDAHLLERGLRNYWGYNTIGFFAPHGLYSSTGSAGRQVDEVKSMVKALHAVGLEVIIDVVYNHTAEGNHLGPTLSMKGIDNPSYYRLIEENRALYFDTTGTGNSFNVGHPSALRLIMDSLRYWAAEMRVDGFRFDLATTLTRQHGDQDIHSAFLNMVEQDPVLAPVKMIAEPWDTAGYQVGGFPARWSEWNGRYRDAVRDFWRGGSSTIGELARRVTGSGDIYSSNRRTPEASVNFVTCHDGFTLADLTSYDCKHNEANGEGNQDGESHNRSWPRRHARGHPGGKAVHRRTITSATSPAGVIARRSGGVAERVSSQRQPNRGETWVRVEGELDIATSPGLWEALKQPSTRDRNECS